MTSPSTQTAADATSERRLVTVLFADVVDSTALADRLDPEDWSEAIRTIVEVMSAPIARYGGTVVRVMGDGVLAVFGAPVAHEDDAVRAVRAGLEVVDAVAGAAPALPREVRGDVRVRVGVNTGLAIVQGLGSSTRDLDALGDAVNVAARMESAAEPGSVLVTGETWRHARYAFDGRPLGAIPVKGKPEPIEAWEVLAPRGRPHGTRGIAGLASPMIGRDEHLERLFSLTVASAAGRGRTALLLGEPGVGKSRLLAELRGRTVARAARWLEARCVSYGETVPYGLLADLVAACVEVGRSGDPHAQRTALEEKLRALFGDEWHEPYASLGHLLSLPLESDVAERLAPLSPEALRLRYLAATDGLLRRLCAGGPTVVVMEDTHWADASSVDIVSRLLPLAHEVPVLMIVSMRPERGIPGWRLVEAARETLGEALTEVALTPLDGSESRLLVSHLLEIETLPERIRSFILERAEGNPFFVEEIIRMLIERGWVVRRDGRWVGSESAAAAEVPDTLRGLLLARIDRLDDHARRTLRVASVIGRDVPVHLLETVIGDPMATSRALGLAEAAGLVRFASADTEPVYRFRHVLVQEAAYDSLLKADRRRLHRRVGEALEERHPERRDEMAPILGLHFERGGDVERAVRYLHLAGRQALRRFAVREARQLLDRAAAMLEAAPETPEVERKRIEIDIDRVEAGVTFMPSDPELAVLAEARRRAERLGDDRVLGIVLAQEAASLELKGGPDVKVPLREAVARATEIGRRLGEPGISALPQAIAASILVAEGRRKEAVPVFEEAVAELERFDVARAAFFAGSLAVTHAVLGDFRAAGREIARAKELAERSGDPNALLDIDIFTGMILSLEGRPGEAAEAARRGTEAAEAMGNILCQVVGSWVVGEQELALGRVAPAIEWLEKARDLAMYCAMTDVQRMSAVTLQLARAMAGEGTGALHGMDTALREARAAGDPLSEGRILLRRGEANARLPGGDRTQAREDLQAAIALFGRIGALPYLQQAQRIHESLPA